MPSVSSRSLDQIDGDDEPCDMNHSDDDDDNYVDVDFDDVDSDDDADDDFLDDDNFFYQEK